MLPGNRNHNPVDGKGDGFLKSRVSGNLGSVISSMGRWRMKLEVCRAEIAEMLPLARLLSRSMDPSVLSRSKVVLCFMSWMFSDRNWYQIEKYDRNNLLLPHYMFVGFFYSKFAVGGIIFNKLSTTA